MAEQKRQVFRLRPAGPLPGWRLVLPGNAPGPRYETTKKGAIRLAARTVRKEAPSQLVVHTRDGRIEFERTYGGDPRRSKG